MMLDGRVTMELDGGERVYMGPISFDIDEPVLVAEMAPPPAGRVHLDENDNSNDNDARRNTTLTGRFTLSTLSDLIEH